MAGGGSSGLSEKRPVTSQMALRLAKMFGGAPETWLRMQSNYDLAFERERMRDELAAIPSLAA